MSVWDIASIFVTTFGLAWLISIVIFEDHDDDFR